MNSSKITKKFDYPFLFMSAATLLGPNLVLKCNFPAKLREVLLYHVVPGLAPSSGVSNDLGLKSAGGQTIRMNIYLRSSIIDINHCPALLVRVQRIKHKILIFR